MRYVRVWFFATTVACQLLVVMLAADSVSAQPLPIATFSIANAQANEYLGQSAATDGQRVFLGTGNGTAYLFDPFTQQQLAKVSLPSQAWYGSVALQGNTGVFGGLNVAKAYDFTNLAAITSKSLVPTGGVLNAFNASVDISGESIIVGANYESAQGGEYSGAAYLFDRATGVEYARLTAGDGKLHDRFGTSVAIDGNRAVVGSFKTDVANGAVYLFDAQPGFVGNRQLAEYTVSPANPNPGEIFGYEVDISGNMVMGLEMVGQVFLWPATGQPAPLPNSQGDHFSSGNSAIAFNGQYAVVGEATYGYVSIYNANGKLVQSLHGPANSPIGFGASVAVGGDLLVVSAPGGDPKKSVVYVYRLSEVLVPEPTTASIAIVGIVMLGVKARRRSTESS